MIFVTVGTQFNFDRLIKALDTAIEQGHTTEPIFAQIGPAQYIPENFEYAEILDKQTFEQKMAEATAIISHAGIGSITTALQHNKPMLVMPRLKKFAELVNDHQSATARKFESLGHVLAAYTEDQLPEKIKQLQNFTPKPRTANPMDICKHITNYLNTI